MLDSSPDDLVALVDEIYDGEDELAGIFASRTPTRKRRASGSAQG